MQQMTLFAFLCFFVFDCDLHTHIGSGQCGRMNLRGSSLITLWKPQSMESIHWSHGAYVSICKFVWRNMSVDHVICWWVCSRWIGNSRHNVVFIAGELHEAFLLDSLDLSTLVSF